jgi:glycosyltransferase involved in cell wall biosynthesis
MTTAPPDVSVLLITYNHEPFVARALDSVLMQRGVTFEVIVSEDCSTDGTLTIVRAAAESDPRITVIASERNLGCNDTVLRVLRAARGRYVSMLDGDDFWIADNKLSRQVARLDADPTLGAYFYNARVVLDDAEEPEDRCWTAADHPARIGIAQIWEGNPFATSAGMLRRAALASIGEWYGEMGRAKGSTMITDWPLYIACAEQGDIAFDPEPVSGYRLHGAGLYSGLPSRSKLDITAELYRRMDAGFQRRHHAFAAAGAASYFTGWMTEFGARGETALARRCAWYAVRSGGVRSWRRFLAEARVALR